MTDNNDQDSPVEDNGGFYDHQRARDGAFNNLSVLQTENVVAKLMSTTS